MRNLIIYDYIIKVQETNMNFILNFIQKCIPFEKEPQKIGLCQLREQPVSISKKETAIKSKDIKLSDLMRRAS